MRCYPGLTVTLAITAMILALKIRHG